MLVKWTEEEWYPVIQMEPASETAYGEELEIPDSLYARWYSATEELYSCQRAFYAVKKEAELKKKQSELANFYKELPEKIEF